MSVGPGSPRETQSEPTGLARDEALLTDRGLAAFRWIFRVMLFFAFVPAWYMSETAFAMILAIVAMDVVLSVRRSQRKPANWLVAAAVGGAAFIALIPLIREFQLVGEWYCSRGEAPTYFEGGGRGCFPEGEPLPSGVRWDPRGNRPLGK